LVPVGFDAIRDETERSFFMNLLTTFSLPDATVDRLVKAGSQILRDSPEFKRLLKDLETSH
jgi:NTE family protein